MFHSINNIGPSNQTRLAYVIRRTGVWYGCMYVCEQVFAYRGVCIEIPTITYYHYLVTAKISSNENR